jgi:hypothetical protein
LFFMIAPPAGRTSATFSLGMPGAAPLFWARNQKAPFWGN